ncbi:MAG TPA: peptidylprolyl isomerase [Flavobacteriaceae bacterium]|nr:peptidylprolyl isomerase [Flavobacteriaceae bacterium]
MAILSKIRDRSMFLIIIVGLALFAFVLDPSSIQSFFSSSKVNAIGEVNGEDIDREEFVQQVEAYRSQNPSRISQMQAVNAVWNQTVGEMIFEKQLADAGIVIGEKDIWEEIKNLPAIQNSPLFRNEANLFDEEKLKEYIANLEDEGGEAWLNWLATEREIKRNLERQAYTNLVGIGLGASLKEGERQYLFENTDIDAELVHVPYSSIADTLITVSKKEIESYIEENKKRFEPAATRSLKFVTYNIVASEKDEEEVKNEVANYINDREEYSNAAKTTVKVPGLKNSTNYESFLLDNKSDLSLDLGYKYKNEVFAEIADDVFNSEIGTVFGPYKQNGYYKISKLIDVTKIPDSVKSSHILIPFAGATSSNSLKSKEAAKKTADSVYALVKGNKEKFAEVADSLNTDGTKGKGGEIGWVRKNQAFSQGFAKNFADYIYKNEAGSVGVVETDFGYHVIRIDEQTESKKAVQLATFARFVEASDETENSIFENAETLNSKLAEENASIDELAKEANVEVATALNLKELDENVPGLGSQRQIVTWAFSPEREVGDSKRFDVDINGKRGYVVTTVTNKTDKDSYALNNEILSTIKPELIKKKKAALIKEKLEGNSLTEIAKNTNTNRRVVTGVNLASPLLSSIGNEPAVVGAMSTMPINEVSEPIEGEKGVFVVKVTDRRKPAELQNYESFRNNLILKRKGRTFEMFQALEKATDIKDYRSKFF